MIAITVMIKNGGYDVVQIPPHFIAQLAKTIKEKGSEWLTLQSGAIEVVGFMVTGKQTGDRVIILGDKGPEATDPAESTQPDRAEAES